MLEYMKRTESYAMMHQYNNLEEILCQISEDKSLQGTKEPLKICCRRWQWMFYITNPSAKNFDVLYIQSHKWNEPIELSKTDPNRPMIKIYAKTHLDLVPNYESTSPHQVYNISNIRNVSKSYKNAQKHKNTIHQVRYSINIKLSNGPNMD